MSEYSQSSYWNERYARDPTPFEWFQDSTALLPLLSRYVSSRSTRVLILGCGTSSLGLDLLNERDLKQLHQIDFSSVCIDLMRKRHSQTPSLLFSCQDACRTDFAAQSFDLIIDKGTLDSAMCSEEGEKNGLRMIEEAQRLLEPEGKFILFSHAPPEHREYLFNNKPSSASSWSSVQYVTLPKPKLDDLEKDDVHYCYVAVKAKK